MNGIACKYQYSDIGKNSGRLCPSASTIRYLFLKYNDLDSLKRNLNLEVKGDKLNWNGVCPHCEEPT